MVQLPGPMCIDATEVTNEQYAAWLAKSPSTSGQPSYCAWNTTFAPTASWPPAAGKEKHPVTAVDWCDAYAFCAGNGKRLCGKLGGGSNAYADYADPAKSVWYRACTSAGKYAFPYGNTYSTTACNGLDKGLNATVPVGSLATCQSPEVDYKGVFDLSGNVLEWEDSCNGATGSADSCRMRGGFFQNSQTYVRCDGARASTRKDTFVGTGMRCCGP
jgi:formylglycine-generating enzyme required for sulfatase activity